MDAPQSDVPLLEPRDLLRRSNVMPEIEMKGVLEQRATIVQRQSDSTSSDSSQTSCSPNDNSGACQKSGSGVTSSTVPIVIGVVIPAMIAAIILFVLHRRHRKMVRKEDAEDRYKSLDFGVDEKALPLKQSKSKKKRQPQPEMSIAQLKTTLRKERGISLDLDMQSPYMLPPELQNSTESLHSLTRSFNDGGDKYRVTDFVPDDGSIRSPSSLRGDNASIYTKSTRKWDTESKTDLLPREPHRDDAESSTHKHLPPQPPKTATLAPPKVETDRNSTVSNASSAGGMAALRASNNYLSAFISGGIKEDHNKPVDKEPAHSLPVTTVTDLGTSPPISEPRSPPSAVIKNDIPSIVFDHKEPSQPKERSSVVSHHQIDTSLDFQLPEFNLTTELTIPEHSSENLTDPSVPPSMQTSGAPSVRSSLANPVPPSIRSSSAHLAPSSMRTSSTNLAPPNEPEQRGRTSYYDYGELYQPETTDSYTDEHTTLPNIQVQHDDYYDDDASDYYDEEGYHEYEDYMGYNYRGSVMGTRPLPPDDPSENPEQRANRIRSFYKEYFDDLARPARQSHNYDDGAMDDVYGYYEQTHPHYRAPSMRSERYRAYSQGSYMPGPRAYSSMSGRQGPRMRPPQKKKAPPPKPLMLLPTPHKLKDDDFLPNAIDFAPPQVFKNQRAGTPDSLRGGSRAYSPSVRAHNPLQSSFDDLAVMPSPHMLRRSGVFTGLDFAPPRRFKENETMSDSGSIRSNRSNISALHAQNIRNGAYRVSRIPKEVAGTRNEMVNALRPKMDMNR